MCAGSVSPIHEYKSFLQFRRHLTPSPHNIPLMLKSIPRGVQYVTLQKYFSHLSFSYLLFFQLKETKTGSATNRRETTNSKQATLTNQTI
jgi:hypothetical protein